jgi:nucleotide-binding universal stress UspA family protein
MSADIAPATGRLADRPILRIVIATDLSEASSGALRLGSEIARTFDADLLIVHVLPDDDVPRSVSRALGMQPGDMLERRAGEAEGRLRHIESVLGRGRAQVHACVRCGSAATEIVRLAKEAAADLIVLGSHRSTAGKGACAEPVAERVRVRASCPVVVALPPRTGEPVKPLDGRSIHGILVATDLNARSNAAVKWGRTLAQRLGCPVHVLHVLRSARCRVTEVVGVGRPDIIRVGNPAQQILSCAQELGDDLIVLGMPRGGVFRSALFGHVGHEVVERAALPTFTAR